MDDVVQESHVERRCMSAAAASSCSARLRISAKNGPWHWREQVRILFVSPKPTQPEAGYEIGG
jgi:hypothetical protein